MRQNLRRTKKFIGSNISFLKSVERRLKESNVPSAAVEAERLVRHFSRLDRLDFFTDQKPVTSRARKSVEEGLKARLSGKPLAFILKEADFFGLKFFVSPDVLTPRPETEILVEEALKTMRSLSATKASADPSKERGETTLYTNNKLVHRAGIEPATR